VTEEAAMQLRDRTLLIDLIPPPQSVANRLGDALREVQLLRRLLRLADLAEQYRLCDQGRRRTAEPQKGASDGR
jgi:hypothetical protein